MKKRYQYSNFSVAEQKKMNCDHKVYWKSKAKILEGRPRWIDDCLNVHQHNNHNCTI